MRASRLHRILQRCVIAIPLFFALSGCGTVALRHSFNDYSAVYAETQNRQMLLNLARLRERHPVYFFQLTGITASYTFTGTTSLSASKGNSAMTPTSAFTHTDAALLGGTATHNPIFTMIPLAGDKFAQELIAPIKADVFYGLYDQGWPVDELMRVLIDRIEVSFPIDATEDKYSRDKRHVVIISNDPHSSPDTYAMFLRTCGMARVFQKTGALTLARSNEFKALPPAQMAPTTASELAAADKMGIEWRTVDGKPQLGISKSKTRFRIDQGENAVAQGIAILQDALSGGSAPRHPYLQPDALVQQLEHAISDKRRNEMAAHTNQAEELAPETETKTSGSIDAFLSLVNTFDVTESPSQTGPAESSTDPKSLQAEVKPAFQVQLVMRSLLTAMAAVAAEEEPMSTLVKNDSFVTQVARDQLRPALKMNWEADGLPKDPLVELQYFNRKFTIGDTTDSGDFEANTWNRDVFRLLVQLSVEVTTDPTLLTTPSLIQLH